MKYNTTTLDNGLRIIHLPSDAQVVYCGYQLAAGTRHEECGEEGLAHFVEHTTFKGTSRRNSIQIINALENVGGELNAFTTKEHTVYYAALLRDHFGRAADLLTDIVFHSTYPEAEVEKEKEVIVEEIESYNDSPAELIYDDFENRLFRRHPLGHNILGTAAHVRSFQAEDAKRFARRHYRPDHAVFFVYGDVDFKKVVQALKKHHRNVTVPTEDTTGKSPTDRLPIQVDLAEEQVATDEPHTIMIDKGTHQAHVMLGCRAYDMHHPNRTALYLLNNMLGGPGLNALLSLSLREKHGLVYTVESTMVAYSDTGIWSVYFGCDRTDVKKCLRLVRKELDKLIKSPISSRKLKIAKQQIKGQIGVATDQRENFAIDFGKAFLHDGKEKDVEQLYRQIDNVTAEQLQAVAAELFPADHMTTLIYE